MSSQKNPEQTSKIPNDLTRKKAAKKKNKAYFKINFKLIFPVDDFLSGSAVVLLSTFPNDTEK